MRRWRIPAVVLVCLMAAVMIGSGFGKNTSVYIGEYEVSEDGSLLTFDAGVMLSIGYIRAVSVDHRENGEVALSFYNAFGGPGHLPASGWKYLSAHAGEGGGRKLAACCRLDLG